MCQLMLIKLLSILENWSVHFKKASLQTQVDDAEQKNIIEIDLTYQEGSWGYFIVSIIKWRYSNIRLLITYGWQD